MSSSFSKLFKLLPVGVVYHLSLMMNKNQRKGLGT